MTASKEMDDEDKEIVMFDLDPSDACVRVVCLPSGGFVWVPTVFMKYASPVWRAARSGNSKGEEQVIQLTATPDATKIMFELLAPHFERHDLRRVSLKVIQELFTLSFKFECLIFLNARMI